MLLVHCHCKIRCIHSLINYCLFFRPGNFTIDDETAKLAGGHHQFVYTLFDPCITWADVRWLTSITKLPIIVKGILSGMLQLNVHNIDIVKYYFFKVIFLIVIVEQEDKKQVKKFNNTTSITVYHSQ